jgi:hypothetical protein
MMNKTMGIDGSSSLKVENAKLPEGATDSMLDDDMENSPWLSDPFLLSLQSGFEESGSADRPDALSFVYKNENSLEEHETKASNVTNEEVAPKHAHKPTVLFAEEVDIIETPKRPEQREAAIFDEKGDLETGVVSEPEKKTTKKSSVDRNAVRFGIRLAFVLTMSSLFVLAQSPESQSYPQGVWVYISALMVSWFPSMDVASVAEKTFQRVVGTLIGASISIALGFLSLRLQMTSFVLQGIFIGCCIAVLSFAISFAMVQYKTSLGKYSYACMLCLLTTGIALLPFYTDERPKYYKGVFRVINVIVGCGIGALGALICWPRSTREMLSDKIEAQVKLAGEASEAVLLLAAETFESRMNNERQAKMISAVALSVRRSIPAKRKSASQTIENDVKVNDEAHAKYNAAIGDWKAVKNVFPLTKYDPFNLFRDSEAYEAYREEVCLTLARALRIQSTVVLLDSVIRSDMGGKCTESQLLLFRETARLIRRMLTAPYNQAKSNAAAGELLDCLAQVRDGVVQESVAVAAEAPMHRQLFCGSVSKEDYKIMLENRDQGMPICVHSRDNCSLLFLQLVEHLIIRCLRSYYMWRTVESK